MRRTQPPQRSGIAGVLFVFSLTALIAGLGFALGAGARTRFWIGDQPAAAAAVGIAGALFAIAAAHVARMLLGRKREQD
jgi:hypothetical protein